MDKIEKALKKLRPRERKWVKEILQQIGSGKTAGLNIQKLKGRDDIFRVRKGDIRVIYRIGEMEKISVLKIERRGEGTYKF